MTETTTQQSAARRVTDHSLLQSLTPRGGKPVAVAAITALVGPSNSGKTETLRDILRLAANFDPSERDRSSEEEPQPMVLSDLNFVPKLTVDRVTLGLTVIDSDSAGETVVQSIGPDLKTPHKRTINRDLQNILYRPVMNAKSIWKSPLGNLMQLRLAYVGPDDRTRLVAPTLAASPLQGPENLLQMLHYADVSIHQALSDAFAAAFDGMQVRLDASEQINLTLRVASEFPEPMDDPIANVRQQRQLRSIHEEGDAYQSFAAIVLTMLLGQGRVILIDQPEAFLQPSQSRFLGRWIAANTSRLACQVFVATRDVAFLTGLAEGAANVTVVRTKRKENITSFYSIPQDTVRSLARFPLFTMQDAMRLLFCDGVVVTAEADDQIVYETAARRLPKSSNIGFMNAAGARNAALVTKVLRQCGMSVCTIVELDVLRSEKELGDLIEAATGSPPPEPWMATRERLAKHVEGSLDEKLIAESANEMEDFLDQIKSGSPPPAAAAKTATKKEDRSDDWNRLQGERLEWLPHELRVWVEELLEDLKRQGIFVSPKGRLEAWLDSGALNRRDWVNQAMQQLHRGECPAELEAFVTDLLAHLNSASSPTRSTRRGNRK